MVAVGNVVGRDGEIAGRWNSVARHKPLREILGAFEGGAIAAWTEDKHIVHLRVGIGSEVFAQAENQRIFVSGYDDVDGVVGHGVGHSLEISGLYIEICAVGGSTGITGSDEKLAHQRALAKFPGQGAFTAAAAEQ